MIALIAVSIIVLAAGAALWFAARRSAQALGMPAEIAYADQDNEVLVSERFGLTGRPDYILEQGNEPVPVERKSRNVSQAGPYGGELLQLAAYCLLVEERYQTKVTRGRLQYLNRSIDVPFDDDLRGWLMRSLEAVDSASEFTVINRSHASPARCRGCRFRQGCGQALV